MSCELYEYDRIDAVQCENIKDSKLIKWPLGDVFSSYLVIFSATLLPICQSGAQMPDEKPSRAGMFTITSHDMYNSGELIPRLASFCRHRGTNNNCVSDSRLHYYIDIYIYIDRYIYPLSCTQLSPPWRCSQNNLSPLSITDSIIRMASLFPSSRVIKHKHCWHGGVCGKIGTE